MILVTVGMHNQGFSRLIRSMDRIAKDTKEEVIMQIGSSNCEPQNASYFRFNSQEEMNQLIQAARIIVTHAGAGSIIKGLSYGKPLIVVPRLKKFDECIDDHQLELAEALSQEGKVIMVSDVEQISGVLHQEETTKYTNIEREKLISALQHYLIELNHSL